MLRVGGPCLGRNLQVSPGGGGGGGSCLGALVSGLAGGSSGPPPPPPTSGLTLWLNGRVGIVSSGGSVSEWQDQSGNGNNFPSVINPTVGSINGKTAVAFAAASSQFLRNTTDTFLGVAAYTMFSVWQYTGNVAWSPPTSANVWGNNPIVLTIGQVSSDRENSGMSAAVDASVATQVDVFGFASNAFADPAIQEVTGLLANPHLLYTAYDNTNVYASLDSGAVQMTAATGNLTSQLFGVVGSGASSTSQNWNGAIGEILVYDRMLSGAEVAQVKAYLKYEWGTLGP
jgi:hypothetical protein